MIKTNIFNKKTTATLALILFATFVFYIVLSFYIIKTEHVIGSLENSLTDAQKINNNLRVQLASASSLEYILDQSSQFSYVEVQDVNYFVKSSDTSVAQR